MTQQEAIEKCKAHWEENVSKALISVQVDVTISNNTMTNAENGIVISKELHE
jgi:hypothetical protein